MDSDPKDPDSDPQDPMTLPFAQGSTPPGEAPQDEPGEVTQAQVIDEIIRGGRLAAEAIARLSERLDRHSERLARIEKRMGLPIGDD
jgi:hypothetical protein